ncbi:MAG: tRNA (guanosine(46)-N7)-methyltransferase TrmB [Candidatus Gracilibacteria bacterium]
MSRKKLHHFAEMKSFPHVYEQNYSSGQQRMTVDFPDHFNNGHPIVLEVGCGRGDYTMALARAFPEKNFVGMDMKGARLWHGAKQSFDEKLSNVAFLRGRVEDLAHYFKPNEVDEIWVTFPDPRPRKSEWCKRLISSRFLALYQSILKPQGVVHLKTDHLGFFEYALEILKAENWNIQQEIHDLYATHLSRGDEGLLKGIQTFYEKKYLAEGRPIYYLNAKKAEQGV